MPSPTERASAPAAPAIWSMEASSVVPCELQLIVSPGGERMSPPVAKPSVPMARVTSSSAKCGSAELTLLAAPPPSQHQDQRC